MAKWRVSAEFTLDIRDEAEARRVAMDFMRAVSQGTTISTQGGQSPEDAMREQVSDPGFTTNTVALVLIGQAADGGSWLSISDIRTRSNPLADD